MPQSPRALVKRLLVLAGALAALSTGLAGSPAGSAFPGPSELFFSEYVEGSGSNKALELYNGTGATVTLTGIYSIQLFANGSATRTSTIPLTGSIGDGEVFVLARSVADAAVLAQADQTTTNFLFNGNDAVALVKDGVPVDVIGQIGNDPGTEWGSGDASTADNTLRRKPSVQAGDPSGGDSFEPAAEWDGFPIDTFGDLGRHDVDRANEGPEAGDDSAVVPEDGGPGAIDVLANDRDADGDALTVAGAGQGGHGAVVVTGGGSAVSYEPSANFNGADSFSYTVSDGNGGTDTATVSVSVSPVNDAPDAVADSATTAEDVTVTLDVLANDSDVDGDPLSVDAATQGAHGKVTVGPAGGVTYTPDPAFHGADSFTYAVRDGNGGVDTAAVAVDVVPAAVPSPCGAAPTIVGTPGDDAIGGTPGDDVIRAGPGNDVIDGNGGHDVVCSGPGNDRIATGAGRDSIDTGPGNDAVTAGDGGDSVALGPGDDSVVTGDGNDRIDTGPGNDAVRAGGGNNTVTGGRGNDWIVAGDGDDSVDGGPGTDLCEAGGGTNAVVNCEAARGDERGAGWPGAWRVPAVGACQAASRASSSTAVTMRRSGELR